MTQTPADAPQRPGNRPQGDEQAPGVPQQGPRRDRPSEARPRYPCGHRTRHTKSIGCCAGCRHLFSSDSAFERHRRRGDCLRPEDAGLVAHSSRSAPGETIWSLPGRDREEGE